MKKVINRFKRIDWILLAMVLSLTALGIIMQYSASKYDLSIVKQQAIYAGIGLAALIIVAVLPFGVIYFLAPWGFVLGLGLTVITGFIGKSVKGARRWLLIGGRTFQPSEFLKTVLIMVLAFVVCRFINEINSNEEIKLRRLPDIIRDKGIRGYLHMVRGYIALMAVIASAALAVAVFNKDLGTAVIIFGIGFIVMIVISPHRKYLVAIGLAGAAGVAALIAAQDFRQDRINAWLHTDELSSDLSYQIKQGLYAIGSGGWFGKGLGKSIQKDVIPEPHTDMIFSIICEELGIIGGIIIITFFIILILRLHKIYDQVTDLFGKIIVIGVTSHIAVQTLVNLAVITNLMPNTGVPLPFISYGGTTLITLYMETGLVMCSRSCILDSK